MRVLTVRSGSTLMYRSITLHRTKCGAGRICGADLNSDNLRTSRAYLRISDHCGVRVGLGLEFGFGPGSGLTLTLTLTGQGQGQN